MDRDDIARRLYAAAEARARKSRVRFGQGADSAIRSMSEQAADRILARAAMTAEPAEALIRAGAAVFEKLVAEMLGARRRIPGYAAARPQTIGEQTLGAALSGLCPIWPLC
jgi:hypothetical protein